MMMRRKGRQDGRAGSAPADSAGKRTTNKLSTGFIIIIIIEALVRVREGSRIF